MKMIFFWCAVTLQGCSHESDKAGKTNTEIGFPTLIYFNDSLNIAFEIPKRWVISVDTDSLVFSGVKDTPFYYTTIVLQALSHSSLTLDQALETIGENIDDGQAKLQILRPELMFIQNGMGLLYQIHFRHFDTHYLRKGFIFANIDNRLIHIFYSAPNTLYWRGLAIFENVLSTLQVTSIPE